MGRIARCFLAMAVGLAFVSSVSTAGAKTYRAGGYSYVVKRFTLSSKPHTTARAACPAKTHVLSGGIAEAGAAGDVRVSHSYPYDSPDAGKAPDDGWAVELSDAVAAPPPRVTAVCAPIRTHYISMTLSVPANGAPAEGAMDIHCASEYHSVLGGGTTGSFAVRETRSFPKEVDGSTDYWRGQAYNDDDQPHSIKAIAICANLNVSDVLTVGGTSMGQSLATAHCLGTDLVVGGGYYTYPGATVTLVSSAPFGFGQDLSGSGWGLTVDDTAGGSTYQAAAICSGPL